MGLEECHVGLVNDTLIQVDLAVDFITNPHHDDVTGSVVVYFRGLQNHTVNTKSIQHDIIIERICDKIHSLKLTII